MQQKKIKRKDYRSLVMYLMTLNLKAAVCSAVLAAFLVFKTNTILAVLITAVVCLLVDAGLKTYYIVLYRRSSRDSREGFLKERKRMWMESITLLKNLLCLIPTVCFIHSR